MRRNRARAERVSIDRSAVQTCLHGYELHDSTSSSRSKQSGMLPSSAGRQMGKAPPVPGSDSAPRSERADNPGVSIPLQDPCSSSTLLPPAGISISRKMSLSHVVLLGFRRNIPPPNRLDAGLECSRIPSGSKSWSSRDFVWNVGNEDEAR
jgi:hypothetical protein